MAGRRFGLGWSGHGGPLLAFDHGKVAGAVRDMIDRCGECVSGQYRAAVRAAGGSGRNQNPRYASRISLEPLIFADVPSALIFPSCMMYT